MTRTGQPSYDEVNAIKADFDDIYRQPDPRAYFRVLGGLDYVIPEVARPVFLQLAERMLEGRTGALTVLDLGCSYGLNAAQLRFGLGLATLRARYLAPEIEALPPEELIGLDRSYFAAWPRRADLRCVGLDASSAAIGYAQRTGLLDAAVAMDLESRDPDEACAAMLRQADLIVSTGCVGYITARTFARVLATLNGRPRPWVAAFVLRVFDYQPIADVLATHGLVTERFPAATFVQRRFRDAVEMSETLDALAARGIDPRGKEADGWLHAELYLSRPRAAVALAPLTELVSLTSGIERVEGDLLERAQRLRDAAA